jgi:NitT/TauT family transport system substrate-binding protein
MSQAKQPEVLVSPMRFRLAFSVAAVALLVGACSSGGSTSPSAAGSAEPSSVATSSAAASPAASSVEPVKLTVGLGYIPSVQFAPFYLAQQEGWYEEAGLDVEFQNKIDPDLITLVGQGAIDVGIGDGTSVIPAVSQGIPIRYLATVYGKSPNIVFAKASSGITTAADLAGRKVGTPGRYGSGWIMLQALLGSAGLTTEDVEIVEYPDFTQRAAVEQGAVDAATGFVNNEPVQLELDGGAATILRIDDITPLPGPGLVAGVATLETKRAQIDAFVQVSLRAMEAITADPQIGLEAAITAVPELAGAREAQLAVLEATIDTWTGPVQEADGLGAIDRDGWTATIEYLTTLGLVPNPVSVDDLIDAGTSRGGY